ncbi:Uu.00g029260.m01.CDS01 [Anthostomella pinea]|uniref:Uu.00g029260.m01.CDS01 n=1 Tax=Anthostomella pinea TaxID=933095 RepID=A0AAI8YD04_9PEZI|nr:Uu.00g029260.m01.CDS01 [Anthostomella pinea]
MAFHDVEAGRCFVAEDKSAAGPWGLELEARTIVASPVTTTWWRSIQFMLEHTDSLFVTVLYTETCPWCPGTFTPWITLWMHCHLRRIDYLPTPQAPYVTESMREYLQALDTGTMADVCHLVLEHARRLSSQPRNAPSYAITLLEDEKTMSCSTALVQCLPVKLARAMVLGVVAAQTKIDVEDPRLIMPDI